MRKNSKNLAKIVPYLLVVWCYWAVPSQAAVVNLTFSEDIDSFSSTWSITDNGGGDFSGATSVAGTFWQVELTSDAAASLQETIGHILGPHGEAFDASSIDYGPLPASFFTAESYIGHDGHQDDFSFTSDFVGGAYEITIAGAHSVPIPAAAWLLGSGLGLLGWLRRKASASRT